MTTGRAARGVIVLVACLFAGLLVLGAILGPATSTETRYMESGREMLASGDWVIPQLNGAPLLEKPPFHYWVTAAAIAVFGVNDVAPRVPSILAGALVLLVVFSICRRFGPANEPEADAQLRGRRAVLFLATMPAFLVQTYVVSMDIWLVLTTTLAGWAVLEAERAEGRARLRWALVLWGSLGFSMLVKGPLAIGLVGGAAAVVAIVRRDAKILRPFASPLGILLFAAISVPWYLAADARIPGLLDRLVTRRLFGALQPTSEGVGHKSALYVAWLPLLGTAPWLAAIPASIRALRDRAQFRRGVGVAALAFALAAPILFSLTPNRTFAYASPAFPWIAILVAVGLPLGSESPRAAASWRREVARAGVGCALVAAAVAMYAYILDPGEPGSVVRNVGIVIAGASAICGIFLSAKLAPRAWTSRPTIGLAAACALCLVVGLGGSVVAHPYLLPANKGLWQEVAAHRKSGEELGMALPATGDWGLFPWYAHEEVRYFGYPTDTVVLASDYRPDLFRPEAAVRAWFQSKERRWLYAREKDLKDLLGDTPSYRVAIGGKTVVVTNLPLGNS